MGSRIPFWGGWVQELTFPPAKGGWVPAGKEGEGWVPSVFTEVGTPRERCGWEREGMEGWVPASARTTDGGGGGSPTLHGGEALGGRTREGGGGWWAGRRGIRLHWGQAGGDGDGSPHTRGQRMGEREEGGGVGWVALRVGGGGMGSRIREDNGWGRGRKDGGLGGVAGGTAFEYNGLKYPQIPVV